MTNSIFLPTTAVAVVIVTAAPAHADSSGFTGFYAPDTWTITKPSVPASADFSPDGSALIITGPDIGLGSTGGLGYSIAVTHLVLTDGIWSFSWDYFSKLRNPGFDAGYYTINGTKFLLDDYVGSGSVSIPVTAGQTIGWQVLSVDGIFGPGFLTITDFRAPVPAPGVFALLSLAACANRRRC